MIDQFLAAAGIEDVVWIDDYFATLSREDAASQINAHIVKAKERGLSISEVQHLGGLDLNRTSSELVRQIEEILTDLDTRSIVEIESALAALVGDVREATEQPDLSPHEFAALKTAFGGRLATYSVGRWTSEGATRYAASTATVLFVIDKEFSRERPGFDGLRILQDLVTRPKSFCIVLTHTCTPDQQDATRLGFASTATLGPHQFCVVSKVQDRDLTVDQRFGRAIFEVFARYLTGQLAFFLADAAAKATTNAVAEISSESIYDIDQAIFENSIEEGTSEIDVLLRIFRARQKLKVNESIQTSAVQHALRTLRDFRAKTAELRRRLGTPKMDLKTFRAWRRDEVFDDGNAVNLLHSPLSCGDIFAANLGGGKTKEYVLLAQPCALTVRGADGERSGEVGMLVPVAAVENAKPANAPAPKAAAEAQEREEEENERVGMLVPVAAVEKKPAAAPPPKKAAVGKKADEDESAYKHFDVKGVLDGNRVWRVDLRYTMYVPLRILELAVFNPGGEVQILRDHSAPAVVLPAGWKIKFDTARSWFPRGKPGADPNKPPMPIAKIPKPIGKGSGTLEVKTTSTAITYPLKRIARVEATVADAIYAAWAVYQTRAAFDHDFAKIEIEEEAPVAAPATAATGAAEVQNAAAPAPSAPVAVACKEDSPAQNAAPATSPADAPGVAKPPGDDAPAERLPKR